MISGTLDWKNFQTWEPVVRDLLSPKCIDAFITNMRLVDTTGYHIGDIAWLTLLAQSHGRSTEELEIALAHKLQARTLRTYHGCRPTALDSYMICGLKTHNHRELVEQVREMIKSDSRLRHVDLDKKVAEISEQFGDLDNGKLFVSFDRRYMTEYAGHYLIYGSEWVVAILGHDNLDPLLERGTPTFIVIDLPGNLAPMHELRDLAYNMLIDWSRNLVQSTDIARLIDVGVQLGHDLDPKYITGHEHPDVINDPLKHAVYVVKNRCCDMSR